MLSCCCHIRDGIGHALQAREQARELQAREQAMVVVFNVLVHG
jgi:hypothetical protein